MTDLPTKTDLTATDTTETEFQEAIGDVYDFLKEVIGGSVLQSSQITSGSFTPTSTLLELDTEGLTSTDDLTNILSTNIGAKLIIIKATSDARVLTVKHLAGGSGQFSLLSGADVPLDSARKIMVFRYNTVSSRWDEIWRNWGALSLAAGDAAALKTQLGFGTAASVDTGTDTDEVPLNSDLGDLAYEDTISSADLLASDVVTTPKILDQAVTKAKMANGTAGSLIAYNASGVPTEIAPGTAGASLVSNGPGQLPSFSGSGGGGGGGGGGGSGATLIGTGDLTGQSEVAVTWSTGAYKTIFVELIDIRHPTNNSELNMRVYRGGSQYSGTAYKTRKNGTTVSALAHWRLAKTLNSQYVRGWLVIPAADSTGSGNPSMMGQVSGDSDSLPVEITGNCEVSGVALSGVSIHKSVGSGGFTSGSFRVWGQA